MDYYEGVTDDDRPLDGGSWAVKHEVCNFLAVEGKCYGYVQPAGETIAIERVGAEPTDEYIDSVTVVWCARSPIAGHTVIVGFYQNARLYRQRQTLPESPFYKQNGLQSYFTVCREEDAILLPHKRRPDRIPRGFGAMGQSLVWYGDNEQGPAQARKVADYLDMRARSGAIEADEKALVDTDGATAGFFNKVQAELEQDIAEILGCDLASSERATLVNTRLGQGKFRKQVSQMWRDGCAVTGCKVDAVLRASHIKAWRDCENSNERLDPDNGLMLTATLDALFDRGLISFKDNGEMLVDHQIASSDRDMLGLSRRLQISPNNGQMRYLKHHRQTYGFE